jgi:hypothetical protein
MRQFFFDFQFKFLELAQQNLIGPGPQGFLPDALIELRVLCFE